LPSPIFSYLIKQQLKRFQRALFAKILN
jgi:hypothetical protein